MKKNCDFLVKHKQFETLVSCGIIYRCELSGALLMEKDLKEKWACDGCIIPDIAKNSPCKHLKPRKTFLIRGSSLTYFECQLLNIIMDTPDFCFINCIMYKQKNI